MFQTEYEFTLPLGYVDEHGNLHREGVMQLATDADEILPLKDPRMQKNPAYLIVILLSRVVTRLGGIESITPHSIEQLCVADLSHLQSLYNQIYQVNGAQHPATCPQCQQVFAPVQAALGGS